MILVLDKNHRRKVSANFSSQEFECPHCGYAIIDTELVRVLEQIRTMVGKPVRITSGYRCPFHNLAVGGEMLSRHIGGMAADVTWAGIILQIQSTSSFRKELLKQSKGLGIYGLGFGARQQFLHVDVDQSRAMLTTWEYP